MPAKKAAGKKPNPLPQPPASDWRTTDQDEIHRRVQRAIDEKHAISNLDPQHPVFSNFRVNSPSGMIYQVEIRDLAGPRFLLHLPGLPHRRPRHLQARRGHPHLAETPRQRGFRARSKRPDPPHRHRPRRATASSIERNLSKLPPSLRPLFDTNGQLLADPAEALRQTPPQLQNPHFPGRRSPFLESRRRADERRRPAPRLRDRRRRGPPPRARHPLPALPLSARGHAAPRLRANAPCSPTKWVSARPSRPSPPAPCFTTSEKPSASSSSPPPRSRPSGRSKSASSPPSTQRIVFGPRSLPRQLLRRP